MGHMGVGHEQVVITWSAPDNGGSSILSYVIYWDNGDSNAELTELVGSPSQLTQTTYTVSDSIVPGVTYRFKVKAVNKWGSGIFSDVLQVLAASIPETISPAPTTSVDSLSGDLVITWNLPDKHGSDLSSYLVQIKNSLGSW